MFSVYGSLDGQASESVSLSLSQLQEYCSAARLVGGLKQSVSNPSEIDLSYYITLGSTLKITMDQTSKKKFEQTYVPMPEFLVNNPNISIYPAKNSSSSQKQLPISVNRTSRTIVGSAPVSVVPVSSLVNNQDQLTKIVADPTETKNCSKRVASSQITNKRPKQPRISFNKATKVLREKIVDPKLSEQISKLSSIEINQVKKTDSSSKLPNNVATSSIPSTSSSVNKLQDSTFKPPLINCIDINCKVDSTVDAEKMLNGTATKFQVSTDVQLKTNQLNSKEMRDSSPTKGFRLEIRTLDSPNDDECYTIKGNELINRILTFVKSNMKSGVPEENQGTSIPCTKVVQTPEHNRLPEPKNISPNLKLNPANHNNIITPTHNNPNSKQSTTKIDTSVKSQRTINTNQLQKSPSKPVAAIQLSANNKQASISVNSSSKTAKPCEIKNPVSSSQHYTPLKHSMATVTQIQSSNKQLNKNQQPSTSTKVVSVTHIPTVTTKKLVGVSHSEKPTVTCQSSLQNVKKCSKCNVLSDDDICTTCLMSSQLKGVTVTRIETPVTESESDIINLDSDKDEEEEELVLKACPSLITEPTITRVETKDQIKKHLDKLSLNPNLLEDKLWHKDLSTKDFFKFDQCHTVQIGSFNTSPVPSGDIIICMHGIRMTVNNTKFEAITIDIPTDSIVKIYGNYAETPTLIIYTNYLAAAGIQHLLKMNEKDRNCYYDPVSKDIEQKKIIWNFDIKRQEVSQLEKLLMKLNGKYEALTLAEMRSISFKKSLNKEKEIKKLQEGELNPDSVIFRDTLEGRKVTMRIRDYKLLAIDEFLNDILMEFYMNRWYMRMLSPEDKNRTYVFNTYFYTTLTRKIQTDLSTTESKSKTRHDRVKKWTKNVNIFEKDFIFIPINESFHWYMIVVCFPYLTGPVYMDDGTPVKTPVDDLEYFETRHFIPPSSDAMKSDCDEADGYSENLRHIEPYYHERVGVSYETDIEHFKQPHFRRIKQPCILILDSLYGNAGQICRAKNVATVREWLAEEYRAKYNGAERDFSINVVKGHTVKVPQQTNFTDCGLFVLHFFEKFFQRPIVDYSLPILHLENWFLADEVQKNCQKRKDVANMIQSIYQEQHTLLPCGTVLPALSFTPKIRGSQNSQQQNRQQQKESFYNDHSEDLENSECDEESEDELDEYDHADESEDFNSHNQCDGYSEEEDEYDHVNDGNLYDYYPEMDDESIEDENDIHSNADYVLAEQDYEGVDDQFDMNPDHENVINVDDSLPGSMSQRNHQHLSNANYALYRSNNLVRSHDDDDDEDDYNEEDYNEDDELTQSTSYSNRHNRHFKRRRLSNQ